MPRNRCNAYPAERNKAQSVEQNDTLSEEAMMAFKEMGLERHDDRLDLNQTA